MKEGKKENTRFDVFVEYDLLGECMQDKMDINEKANMDHNEKNKKEPNKAQIKERGKRPAIQIT